MAKLLNSDRPRRARKPKTRPLPSKPAAAKSTFPSVLSAHGFLVGAGWRISTKQLYRHHKEGKFSPDKDGIYHAEDLDRYARTWLRRRATGRKERVEEEELQRRKAEAEIERLRVKTEREQIALEKDRGKLIPREDVEQELAGRAMILDAGLRNWIQSRSPDWVRVVDGDQNKADDMRVVMMRELDELMNQYARAIEYEIIFEGTDVDN